MHRVEKQKSSETESGVKWGKNEGKRNILVLLALSLQMGLSKGTQTGREEGMERWMRKRNEGKDGEK